MLNKLCWPTLMLITLVACSEATNTAMDQVIDADIKNMSGKLPLKVSEGMAITSMERKGREVIYTYSFLSNDIQPGKFDTKLAQEAGKSQLCKTQQTMEMMEDGYVFVYRYKYQNGQVETLNFSKKDC